MNEKIRADQPAYPALARQLAVLKARAPGSWRIAVLERVLAELDFAGYDALQRRFLDDSAIHRERKFLDLPYWLKSKMDIAERFGLHEAPPRRILDIGGGNGLFAVVLRSLGHEVVITDTAVNPMYEALVALHGLDREKLIVQAMTPVALERGRFDLVTALMTVFNKRPHQWKEPEWGFFLHDVATNLLRPDGRLLLKLSLKNQEAGFRRWLEGLGAEVAEKQSFVYFADTARLRGALG